MPRNGRLAQAPATLRTTRTAAAGANAQVQGQPSYAEVPSDEDLFENVPSYRGGTKRARKHFDDSGRRLPKPKKAKQPRKSNTGRHAPRLRLDGLLDAPLEIIQSIFSDLSPQDLTALSRTNRALRQLLLNRRTGLVIYRRVFGRLFAQGLPKPTPRLSLPAYAFVLSIRKCSVCAKDLNRHKWTNAVCISSRSAFCSKCFKEELVSFDKPKVKAEYEAIDPRVTALVAPHIVYQDHRYRRWNHDASQDTPPTMLYSRRAIDELFDELDALDEADGDLLAHFNARAAEIQFRFQQGKTLNGPVNKWLRSRLYMDRPTVPVIAPPRPPTKQEIARAAIQERLEADSDGVYDSDIIRYLTDVNFGYTVMPTAEVNDAAWARIKVKCDAALVRRDNETLEAAEESRIRERLIDIEDKFAQLRNQRQSTALDYPPPLIAFLRRPDWRALAEDEGQDEERMQARWNELQDGFEDAIAEIRAEALADLATIQRADIVEGDDDGVTDLALVQRASSVFRCSKCRKDRLYHPSILDHDCGERRLMLPSKDPNDRPMRKMELSRPGLRDLVQTSLEAASLDPHMPATELTHFTDTFFISPLYKKPLERANAAKWLRSFVTRRFQLLPTLIGIIDLNLDRGLAHFVRISVPKPDADMLDDLTELAECGRCSTQKIDRVREIRIHLGKAHGLFVKADHTVPVLKSFYAKANALTLTDQQDRINEGPEILPQGAVIKSSADADDESGFSRRRRRSHYQHGRLPSPVHAHAVLVLSDGDSDDENAMSDQPSSHVPPAGF